MLDRQRIRREDAVRVEDVIPEEILNDTRVDREYLEQVFREPQKFVPARTREVPAPRPEPEEDEPESRAARRAKLAGLVAAGLLVAGAVVTAGVLAGTQREGTAPGASAPETMSGAAALGGLAVPDSTEPQQRKQETPTSSGTSTKAQPSSGTGSGSLPRQSSSAGSTSPQPSAKPVAVSTVEDKIEAVRTFYRTVDADPYGAMSLITPVLAESEAGRLIESWSAMDAIQIQDLREQADGTILAVVTMRNPDGGLLRVTQILEFADETTGLITDARLLSAQHM
ncbi:hypothetical protein [Amycolatopsis keratiniphila]|uniref:Uncharacterized protein n=1 Tax=Amycolatopsis keratiniphila subsp. keratiniphila TaxID=227715 RepID=A0A1W2LPW3_9PSEU|nr:hypothetical protein [Amycolatopsis keratiniphila]OLZ55914.1 hypothetical protein BS330_17365 [Amycolatopsis keratiniphila subsp. nogabecina]ONF65784.1 hypothetical protein AVR91_0226070 [Amycolatopsis keratiniphila subsp. keratiniphila]SDU50367.1 hypothetical protein SAMN04489733_5137 [Amycolatopsis keratiniphila]